MFWLIGKLVVGLVVGVIAKFLMPGKDPGGFIVTVALGIAGSVIAGYLLTAVGHYQDGQAAGWIASIVGAMILLGVYRLVMGNKSSS